jgi:putative ABC transport system permease protein
VSKIYGSGPPRVQALRQLSMLAAIGGATERHLRLVLLANGAVVGAIAAVIGTAVAMASWITIAPALETATGNRIDRFDLPWWLIGAGMLLAVVTATAAWWPARWRSGSWRRPVRERRSRCG